MQDDPAAPENAPDSGVLIRADNGDVVTFDATGLTLRLSDTVLADLRARLGVTETAAPDPAILGDIDAWDLRQAGGWLHFTARLEAEPRGYRRLAAGGAIIAAAPGPLLALLSLGGARRAGFNDAPPDFVHNVLAPGDHIGAVGWEGCGTAEPQAALHHIAHATRDALIADTLLHWRRDARQGLPLFFVRSETDGAADVAALGRGRAYANFLAALDSLVLAAAALGKRPRVLAVGLDYALEDQQSTAAGFAAGIRGLMRQIEGDMAARGLHRPVFIATAEAGTARIARHPAIRAQWELAWSHGPHRLAFSAPGYMFAQDRFGRPTATARVQMAEMDAHAITALEARHGWLCPLPLLAEYQGHRIRVTLRAMADLVLDAADPFAAGPGCGFHLAGGPRILDVALAPDDPQALILTCDGVPVPGAELLYACDAPGPPDSLAGGPPDRPANRGALRDTWAAPSRAGGLLHRWALPAALPLHPGAGAW
jgi:hypothetical protein